MALSKPKLILTNGDIKDVSSSKQTVMTTLKSVIANFTESEKQSVTNLLWSMQTTNVDDYMNTVEFCDVVADMIGYANKLWEHKEEIPTDQLETQIIPQLSMIHDFVGMRKRIEEEETQKRTNLLKTFASYINKFNQ